MYHTVQMIIVLQMRFVKADQQQIVKVSGFGFELRNDGDLQLPLSWKLIP